MKVRETVSVVKTPKTSQTFHDTMSIKQKRKTMTLILWDTHSHITVSAGDEIINKHNYTVYNVGKRGRSPKWINWNLISRADMPDVKRCVKSNKSKSVKHVSAEDCSIAKYADINDTLVCGMRDIFTPVNIKNICALMERKLLLNLCGEWADIYDGKSLSDLVKNHIEGGWGGICIRLANIMNSVWRKMNVGINPLYKQNDADVNYAWANADGEWKFKIDDCGEVAGCFQGSTHGGNKAPYTLMYFGLRKNYILNMKQAMVDEVSNKESVYDADNSLVTSIFLAVGIDKSVLSITGKPSEKSSRTNIRIPSDNFDIFKKKVIVGKIKKNNTWVKMIGSPISGLNNPSIQ